MRQYIIKRLLLILLTLLGLITITFLVARVAPGDPARAAAGEDATQEMVETLREEFGLNEPLYVQYAEYIKGIFTGNLGKSIRTQHMVAHDLVRYFPATLELTIFSLIMAVLLGIPLGVICAVKKDSMIDHLARLVSVSGLAVPMFWLGLMLQLIFSLYFDLFPTGGRLGMLTVPPPSVTHFYLIDSLLAGQWSTFKDALSHIFLPAVVLSFPALASIIRVNRSDMLEVLKRDFITSARAHGISQTRIVGQYALKNAMIPTATMIGLRFGWMLGGTILVETVFDWPGLGNYAVQSAVYSDFQPIMGATLAIGLSFMVATLIVDLIYGLLDPRVRYE
ncbi:MAG: ABC transporter permease [Deltaproteobacteria bacterium]|nr:MAG: ABC transporter permease [Deltaproteobacteria bacterium]RLC19233.1 MAG: ABC transporter permease [Deltaproteobacteria bacterium]